MKKEFDDGGQAFPNATGDHEHGGDWVDGQTLLDHFAGQALQGLLSFESSSVNWELMAKDCYDMAEAMVEEKRKRENEANKENN